MQLPFPYARCLVHASAGYHNNAQLAKRPRCQPFPCHVLTLAVPFPSLYDNRRDVQSDAAVAIKVIDLEDV